MLSAASAMLSVSVVLAVKEGDEDEEVNDDEEAEEAEDDDDEIWSAAVSGDVLRGGKRVDMALT